MKITQQHLKLIIKEELERVIESDDLEEGLWDALKGGVAKVADDVKQYGTDVRKAGQKASKIADIKKIKQEINSLNTKQKQLTQQLSALIDNDPELAGIAAGAETKPQPPPPPTPTPPIVKTKKKLTRKP